MFMNTMHAIVVFEFTIVGSHSGYGYVVTDKLKISMRHALYIKHLAHTKADCFYHLSRLLLDIVRFLEIIIFCLCTWRFVGVFIT